MRDAHRWIGVSLVVVIAGCGAGRSSAESGDTGQITVALASSGGTGTTTSSFVLGNASFRVTGPTNTFVLTSADPSATDLTATVPVGRYTITLLPGWQIERRDVSQAQTQSTAVSLTPVDGTLLSSATVVVSVFSGQATAVAFQFQTSGIPLTFAPGGLDVGAQISTCDPQPPSGVELNVVTNHDFETDTAGWTTRVDGSFSRSTDSHCGAHSGQVSSQSSDILQANYLLPVGAGSTFAVSAWIKRHDASGAAGDLEFAGAGSSDTCFQDLEHHSAPSDVWVRYSGTLTLPPGCSDIVITVLAIVHGADSRNALLIDDVYAIPQ